MSTVLPALINIKRWGHETVKKKDKNNCGVKKWAVHPAVFTILHSQDFLQ